VTDVSVPKLSMAMEDAVVLRWLVEDCDEVVQDQAILFVETDKSEVEIYAPATGTIRLCATEGEIVKVDGLLARIVAPGETDDGGGDEAVQSQRPSGRVESQDEVVREIRPTPAASKAEGRIAASPAAKSLAAAEGVDLGDLTGSGPGGRIVEDDVRRQVESKSRGTLDRLSVHTAGSSNRRRAVVANLAASWSNIPHINIGGHLAADGLQEARTIIQRRATDGITISDLLILAVSATFIDVPELAGTTDATGARSATSGVHLALAVAAAGGVVAPTLRNAEQLGLSTISTERARLVDAARSGNLAPRDSSGATCTLSNLGAFPVDFFTPVITGPQVSLIAVGRVHATTVVEHDRIGIGHRLWVNVAIDHRVADGEAGGRFLKALERHLVELPRRVLDELENGETH